MALSLDEVKRIAALTQLRLSPEEELLYAEQLGRIVDYVDQLKARQGLDAGILPGAASPPEPSSVADVELPGLDRQVVLEAAPRSDGEFVVVPRIQAGSSRPGGPR